MKKPKSLLFFNLLAGYIFLQFIWWSYLLFDLNKELYTDPSELHKKWTMIAGEGIVFLGILVFGVYKIRVNLKKEAAVALQQQNFLLSVTHELKSPLASLRLIFETITKRDLSKEKVKEIALNGAQDVNRLNKLVENILLSARLDDANFKLNMGKEDISSYITNITQKLKSGIAREHNLVCDVAPNIELTMDKFMFESILFNLIENSCKYSTKGSSIKILLNKSEDKVSIVISDEGIGITENEIANITKKFYRVGNEETRSAKGTGLGLFIVSHLVNRHGGNMLITSKVNKGTTVTLTFIQ